MGGCFSSSSGAAAGRERRKGPARVSPNAYAGHCWPGLLAVWGMPFLRCTGGTARGSGRCGVWFGAAHLHRWPPLCHTASTTSAPRRALRIFSHLPMATFVKQSMLAAAVGGDSPGRPLPVIGAVFMVHDPEAVRQWLTAPCRRPAGHLLFFLCLPPLYLLCTIGQHQ